MELSDGVTGCGQVVSGEGLCASNFSVTSSNVFMEWTRNKKDVHVLGNSI